MLEEFLLEHYILSMLFSIFIVMCIYDIVIAIINRKRPIVKCSCNKEDE